LDEEKTEVVSLSSSDKLVVGFLSDISRTGRYVLFTAKESGVTTNPCASAGCEDQVYLRDLQEGATELISVASDGTQGNGKSGSGTVTDDGRFVTFISCATNLIDTSGEPPPQPQCTNSAFSWYVRDRLEDTTSHSE
jgi:hypothetical protein